MPLEGLELVKWLRSLREPKALPFISGRVPGAPEKGPSLPERRLVEQMRAKALAEQQAERKFAFEQMKYQKEQERKKWELILNKRIDYIEGLELGSANRELAQERTRDLASSMPSWAQQALAPHLERLFPPEVEKRDEFIRTNGKRPEVTADPTKDSFGAGMQRLAGDRYDWRLQKHMGVDPGAKFPSVAPAGPKEYVVHEEGDRPRLISLDDEALAEKAKALYGSPTAEMVIANGGEWAMEKPVIFDVGRRKMKVTKMARVTAKEGGSYDKIENIWTNPNPEETEPHPEIVNFASYYSMGADEDEAKKTPQGRHYLGWLERMEAGLTPNQALQGIKEATGWNVKILAPGEFKTPWYWENGYVKGATETLVYWPGEMKPFAGKNNTHHFFYHDTATDYVYNGEGRKLGLYETVLTGAAEEEGEKIAR